MITKDFVSCVHGRLYFFTAAHFHLAAMKYSCFSSNEIRLPSSFSVFHVSVNIKNNVENDPNLLLFFSLSLSLSLPLKLRAAMRIILYWCACGADGRSLAQAVYGNVITKFSRVGRFT